MLSYRGNTNGAQIIYSSPEAHQYARITGMSSVMPRFENSSLRTPKEVGLNEQTMIHPTLKLVLL